MQVIGLCRFSYPAIGGFQVEHETIEQRIAYLYDAERMEERFRLLETIALPCLREQTDQDFTLIVVTGDSLPRIHRDRLHDLTADMPQVQIRAEPPRRHREVMKEILNSARRDPDQPCLQFRHDDDDAVSVDFTERLRAAAGDCQGLLRKNRSVAFDFNRGYLAEAGPQGIRAAEDVFPYVVAALGMYVRGGCPLTVMNFAHHKINRFMPTVTVTDAPMFVRTRNRFNDSRDMAGGPALEPLTPELAGAFEARFAVREARVRDVFGKDRAA
ncbi:putative rhamnosyl transferase [Leisingera daeponensis]|uniref:putative rhamnosyl transferase n=1 Tax=Leisingera daeponensis TaxID=405746 RepID=UPI00041133FB|nr:putative rhamnosyl transferase [Leisingera daeponensis]